MDHVLRSYIHDNETIYLLRTDDYLAAFTQGM